MATRPNQTCHWCFTYNMPDDEDWTSATSEAPVVLWDQGEMSYLVYQVEKGTHMHLQGYVCLLRKKRLAQVSSILGGHVHLERMKGRPDQAAAYCKKKDETYIAGPWEWGTAPDSRGKKSATALAVEDVVAGKPLTEVAKNHPLAWVRSYRGLKDLQAELAVPTGTWREVSVYVLWGPTRTGKTRTAMADTCADGRAPYRLPLSDSMWFDGYEGQDTLVIDDFYGQIKFHHMLNILDGYYVQVAVKGGFVWGRWTKVYITSNGHPDTWWAKSDIPQPSREAMAARFKEVKCMDPGYQ